MLIQVENPKISLLWGLEMMHVVMQHDLHLMQQTSSKLSGNIATEEQFSLFMILLLLILS